MSKYAIEEDYTGGSTSLALAEVLTIPKRGGRPGVQDIEARFGMYVLGGTAPTIAPASETSYDDWELTRLRIEEVSAQRSHWVDLRLERNLNELEQAVYDRLTETLRRLVMPIYSDAGKEIKRRSTIGSFLSGTFSKKSTPPSSYR